MRILEQLQQVVSGFNQLGTGSSEDPLAQPIKPLGQLVGMNVTAEEEYLDHQKRQQSPAQTVGCLLTCKSNHTALYQPSFEPPPKITEEGRIVRLYGQPVAFSKHMINEATHYMPVPSYNETAEKINYQNGFYPVGGMPTPTGLDEWLNTVCTQFPNGTSSYPYPNVTACEGEYSGPPPTIPTPTPAPPHIVIDMTNAPLPTQSPTLNPIHEPNSTNVRQVGLIIGATTGGGAVLMFVGGIAVAGRWLYNYFFSKPKPTQETPLDHA